MHIDDDKVTVTTARWERPFAAFGAELVVPVADVEGIEVVDRPL